MCCSVLQCVAVYCSVLHCVAVCCSVFAACYGSMIMRHGQFSMYSEFARFCQGRENMRIEALLQYKYVLLQYKYVLQESVHTFFALEKSLEILRASIYVYYTLSRAASILKSCFSLNSQKLFLSSFGSVQLVCKTTFQNIYRREKISINALSGFRNFQYSVLWLFYVVIENVK